MRFYCISKVKCWDLCKALIRIVKYKISLITNFKFFEISARDELFQVSVPEDNIFLNKHIEQKLCDGELNQENFPVMKKTFQDISNILPL